MECLKNTFIIEFKKQWFGKRINIYHSCNVDRELLVQQPFTILARDFTCGIFDKLIYCSMSPEGYQRLWEKANSDKEPNLSCRYMV